MLRIGLTGGIGSGKSEAARCFSNLGIPVIDSDEISRDLVAPDQPALQQIVDHFGTGVITTEGELNREALRQKVMQDSESRQWLEQLLYPLIRQRREELISQIEAPYVVLEIPLLLESGLQELVDRILVVDVPESLQVERTRRRSGLDEAEVRAVMKQQASRQQRLNAADDLIDNSGSRELLEQQVQLLHERYRELARSSC